MLFGDNSGYVGALRRSTKVTQWGSEATRKKIRNNSKELIFWRENWRKKKKKRKKKRKEKEEKKENV